MALRALTRVQTEVLVIFADAILDHDIMEDLPTHPVALVVAGGQSTDVDAVAVPQEDVNRGIDVKIVIVCEVAVEDKFSIRMSSANSPLSSENSVGRVAVGFD